MRLAFALCLFVPLLPGQVHVGRPAPKLSRMQVIQGQLDDSHRGKAVIIEFWATTCGPCVANIPHWNQLADQFKDREVEFLSLTPEEGPVVTAFLRRRPIRGTVALDPGEAIMKAYGAGTPTTVLIDREGNVVRVMHPSQLTATMLDDLISDRPLQLAATRPDMLGPLGRCDGLYTRGQRSLAGLG